MNNQIPWRGDSAWEDGKEAGLDLSRGLYDAGDHMKFGLPMAFTATILSWTILEYDDQLVRDAKRNLAADGLRWITDYLVNAHSADNVLCIQVQLEARLLISFILSTSSWFCYCCCFLLIERDYKSHLMLHR